MERDTPFSKRCKGLFKKAQELSLRCDADISVIVFSNGGNTYEYSSTGRQSDGTYLDQVSVTELVQLEEQMNASLQQVKSKKEARLTEENDLLRAEEARLTEENDRLRAEMAALEHQREANDAA